ncbi:MAG: AraC family ligand binding domain-containing protein [Kiloniellaceae bacterium]
MQGPRVFRRADMTLKPAVTPSGSTSIARVIDSSISAHMGGGIEYLEDVEIDWTVTYDEILFILEGPLTVAFEDNTHDCRTGDIIWLPAGTKLRYIAKGRAAYFYALYPVDWAARQGTAEP